MDTQMLWDLYRETGDPTARDTLVQESIGLVHHVARQMARRLSGPGSHEELVSAGSIGLIQAVESYDPGRGYAFSTFAAQRIRGAILDELRRTDPLSRGARRKCRAIAGAERAVELRTGRRPTPVEVAEELEIELETYWQWREYVEFEASSSLHEARREELESAAWDGDAAGVEDSLEHEEQIACVRDMIFALPEQQRIVLTLAYFEGLQNCQIAVVMGLTPSRISQIRKQALETLRALAATG